MSVPVSLMYDVARSYLASGLSIIPIDPNPTKKPAYNLLPITGEWPGGRPKRGWKPFTRRRATEEELQRWFNTWGCCCGIGVVCGAISGGVETIDIDSMEYADPWLSQVRLRTPHLIDKFVMVQTPRPGLHVYYRCSTVGRSQKLAEKLEIDQLTTAATEKTLIETRGERGYAVIPPTPGHCHPTGRIYQYCSDRTLMNVQEISVEERSLLFEICRSFDEMPRRQSTTVVRAVPRRPPDLRRPDDAFNARAEWPELLENHGWSFSHRDPDGKEHWTRPGKSEGTSATLHYEGNDLLHVFSSNVTPLEHGRSYTKFHFLAVMEFEGDFNRAKQSLMASGYGQRPGVAERRKRPQSTTRRSSSINSRRRRR